MKKIFSVTVCFLLLVSFADAQTFSEWFRQKKTQIKYLIQQIAAYEVLLDYTTKGYNIAQTGLTFIGDMKKGEFDLHTTYFNSLQVVSPNVSKYSRINDIISYEIAIMSDFKKILQTKNMNPAETNYLNAVYNNMNNECNKSIDELIDIVTDDTYTMKDDQRIKRIDGIYYDMKNKYAFSQSFTSEAAMLSLNRISETGDESMLNNLYNIK
ncbi:MAG TPA: hypothetical protein VK787_15740 [Puia sp.]|jgi:hypothetical protein|nr:hypothetical protein [Puia sp.]